MVPPLPDPSRFRPLDYFEAAIARLQEARELQETARLGLAITQAGVAAECILRAFVPEDEAFDGRHNIYDIARKSRLRPRRLEIVAEHDAAINTLSRVWRNSYRYMTEAKINAILRRLPQYQKSTGHQRALRQASRDAIEAATWLVTLGSNRWNSQSNS